MKELQAAGAESLRAVAEGLEARGIPAARGGKWSAVQVSRLLARLPGPFGASVVVAVMAYDYVSFNQYEDALASLELVALVAPLVRDKPQYWKWIIVGAHNALQGAMVCAYAGASSRTAVLEEKSAKEMRKWIEADPATRGPYPEERLAPFLNAALPGPLSSTRSC